jgi:dihydrofolate reductase
MSNKISSEAGFAMTGQVTTDYPKVSLIMVMSANGVVAQKAVQNSFEWNSVEDREQFLKKIHEIGAVLMGSNTYRAIGGKPYAGIDFFVLSRRPEQFVSHNRVTFVQGSVEQVLRELGQSGVKRIALLGGPHTNAQCFENQLVDDIYLTMEPLMMPEGMHIASDLSHRVNLVLESVQSLNEAKTLLLHYRVIKQQPTGDQSR